ncbi:peptidoglycan DD-metalloendopeptidase family protein [uncultured Cohaesibacter sp.]|uniref:peptidoglycan DD-metalloendopeptidase family protein n=1 Tax=uncultured Cohaesibacter sp. TaxID=1002546 RepID=UPI002931E827|nr:peptidoglycan DD-metalloendopeptidase family protein [uncultured Cohaesibacter sp.]
MFAIATSLAACSSEMDRFGTPGSGFTSNQNEIFTNSVGSGPVGTAVNQPMPAAIPATSTVSKSAPVYQVPNYKASAPTYSAPRYQASVKPVPSYQTPTYRTPVYTTPKTNLSGQYPPDTLATGSISRSGVQGPVQGYSMPELPSASSQAASGPTYVSVPVRNTVPSRSYQASVEQSVLNSPPIVVSRFTSLPKAAPRAKMQMAGYAPANYSSNAPVAVPVAEQPTSKRSLNLSRFSIAKLFSLPKKAPRTKELDYSSTASITPPAAISNQGGSGYVAQAVNNRSVLPSQAVGVRKSGQWVSSGGTMVTVGYGEDIQTLSRRYGVPAKAIAEVNGLADQSFVAPGQSILIPVYQQETVSYQSNYPTNTVQQAAYEEASPLPFSLRVPKANPLRQQSRSPYGQQIVRLQQNANAQNRHMVMPGETLSGIASRYDVSTQELASANGLAVSSPIRMGQRLRIPMPGQQMVDYTSTASIGPSQVNAGASIPAAPVHKIPKSKPRWIAQLSSNGSRDQSSSIVTGSIENNVASSSSGSGRLPVSQVAQPGSSASEPAAKANSVQQGNTAKFRWPVRGRIITSFGRGSNGTQNDGINLSVPIGTSVRAAESGTVIYAGNKLKGYGNLVLVQHSNGWVTAYAHNDKVLVAKGQHIRRGQIIAQSGKSGSVNSPQLHFELRIQGDPVDPVPYLATS